MRKDLCEIIEDIRSFPEIENIGITTNGSLLPKKLEKLKAAGLNSLNISLDTLVEAKNQFITRRPGGFTQTLKVKLVDLMFQSIDKAIEMRFESVKVNVVVMKNFNDDELFDFVEFVKERPIEVRFIEFMPFD